MHGAPQAAVQPTAPIYADLYHAYGSHSIPDWRDVSFFCDGSGFARTQYWPSSLKEKVFAVSRMSGRVSLRA